MNTPHEVLLQANYRFFKVSKDALPLILSDHFGDQRNIESYKRRLARGDQFLLQSIPKVLAASERLEKYGVIESRYHNIVPSVLRNSLAAKIAGITVTPTFAANYMALGSGSTAVANSDEDLDTETLRGLFTNRSSLLNVATLDKFFDTTQVGGNTYNEAGVFVDGTGSADSGYLLSRVLINETMGANETLTINATFTIS